MVVKEFFLHILLQFDKKEKIKSMCELMEERIFKLIFPQMDPHIKYITVLLGHNLEPDGPRHLETDPAPRMDAPGLERLGEHYT